VCVCMYEQVIEQVGRDFLTTRYGSLLRPTAEPGFSLSLQVRSIFLVGGLWLAV
jgi:hypothetical protein